MILLKFTESKSYTCTTVTVHFCTETINSAKIKRKPGKLYDTREHTIVYHNTIMYPKKLSKKIKKIDKICAKRQTVNPGVHGAWNSLGDVADPVPDPVIPPPLGHRITEMTVLAKTVGGVGGSHLLLPFTQSPYIHPSNHSYIMYIYST